MENGIQQYCASMIGGEVISDLLESIRKATTEWKAYGMGKKSARAVAVKKGKITMRTTSNVAEFKSENYATWIESLSVRYRQRQINAAFADN